MNHFPTDPLTSPYPRALEVWGRGDSQSKDDDPRRKRTRELSRLGLIKYKRCRSRRGVRQGMFSIGQQA
jgi:hypothetical protein